MMVNWIGFLADKFDFQDQLMCVPDKGPYAEKLTNQGGPA